MANDGYFIGEKNGVTEQELNQALLNKSDSDHTHTYDEITGKPAIPDTTSDLTNDSGYISGSYDNTTSGLTSTNIQDAIDELKALIDGLGGA